MALYLLSTLVTFEDLILSNWSMSMSSTFTLLGRDCRGCNTFAAESAARRKLAEVWSLESLGFFRSPLTGNSAGRVWQSEVQRVSETLNVKKKVNYNLFLSVTKRSAVTKQSFKALLCDSWVNEAWDGFKLKHIEKAMEISLSLQFYFWQTKPPSWHQLQHDTHAHSTTTTRVFS